MHSFWISTSPSAVLEFAGCAAVALVLGAFIGIEHQWHQRMAGLRTNPPVALGAALVELSAVLVSSAHGVDPTRMAAYVVSGVGFYGESAVIPNSAVVTGILAAQNRFVGLARST